MKQKPYLSIQKFSLRFAYLIYIDVRDYLADPLFVKHGVRIRCGKECAIPDSPYRFILCRVRKRDVQGFHDALEELENSMLICGYTDYEREASSWLGKLGNLKKGADANDKNDPVGEAEQGQTA